jgi:pyruvate-formate lyase-activating enzyme
VFACRKKIIRSNYHEPQFRKQPPSACTGCGKKHAKWKRWIPVCGQPAKIPQERKGQVRETASNGISTKFMTPTCIVADENGSIVEIPGLLMAGQSLSGLNVPSDKDIIPLPGGSDVFILPGRSAVGFDPAQRQFVAIEEYHGKRVYPVAVFISPGHMQLYFAAYMEPAAGAPRLPLYCYTAAGWKNGRIHAAGMRVDRQRRHDPSGFPVASIMLRELSIKKKLFSGNRIAAHLIDNCVGKYGCPNAKNFVLGRWECGIPVSRTCNCGCLGCISHQSAGSGCVASHDRLDFTPTPEEIAAVAVPHLKNARQAMISFGQGCEGEPLCEAELIEESIRMIRARTRRGVIHMNTNGSMPDRLERLFAAGLDSIRISLVSAQPGIYKRYHRPRRFGLPDIVKSMRIARRMGKWVSVNYLVFPGLTDSRLETRAFDSLIRTTGINMVQIRNFSIDPLWLIRKLGLDSRPDEAGGMNRWLENLRKKFPELQIGCFNPHIIRTADSGIIN